MYLLTATTDRNKDRKLSEVERKEKKMEKVEVDKKAGTHVAVFKVNDLSSKKNRYKVDINASENHLTGWYGCSGGNMLCLAACLPAAVPTVCLRGTHALAGWLAGLGVAVRLAVAAAWCTRGTSRW